MVNESPLYSLGYASRFTFVGIQMMLKIEAAVMVKVRACISVELR